MTWLAAVLACNICAPLNGQVASLVSPVPSLPEAVDEQGTTTADTGVTERLHEQLVWRARRHREMNRPSANIVAPITVLPAVPSACPVVRTVGPVSTTVNIYDPTFTAYDNGLVPPITTFNNSAYWAVVTYPDLNPILAMQLTVQISADSNCLAPSNADPAYHPAQCARAIAPAEFQIGLRGPDGVYYPLLDRESGAAAQTQAASLCMNFYHNQMPTYCSAPGTPLTFGQMMPGVVGKLLTGTWRIVVTRTASIITENPIGTLHGQGGAIVTGYTLTPTTDAPCAADLRVISLGLSLDTCTTLGTGHRNGFLDPKESASFRPQIFNNGSVNATSSRMDLSSISPALTISAGSPNNFGNVPAGAVVIPNTTFTISSTDTACNNLPLTIALTGTGGFSQTINTTLQQGRPTNATTDIATALNDISTLNLPQNTPWLVSNTTGATFNSSLSRYDYTDQCGADPVAWPFWPGSPKSFGSEPYLLGPLFTNRTCTTRANPGAGLPNPVCFYTANSNLNSMFGSNQNYIHLETSSLSWGIPYDSACTDGNGNNPPAGADTRLTSNSVSAAGYSTVRLVFTQAFWTLWDVAFAFETVRRDNIASVEIASSITDGGTGCPLEPLTGRRWCEVFKLQNHSTPYTTFSTLDVSAFAAGATSVQIRFRFRDAGWYQSSTGDLYWALRDVRLQGLGASIIDCNICTTCQAVSFLGIQSATDVDGCNDSGIDIRFTNPGTALDPNTAWGDCPAGGADCLVAQPLRRFDIYRSDNPTLVLQSIPWSSVAPGAQHTANDNTAANNTNFTYRVEAVNRCGNAADGGVGAVRTAQDHLGVNPGFAGISTATDNNACLASGITVTWQTPSDWGDGSTGGSVLRQFTGQRDQGAGFSTIFTSTNSFLVSFNDTTVTPAVLATYKIITRNRCNLSTGDGITLNATDARDTILPPVVENVLESKSGSNAVLTWSSCTDACGIPNYRVYGDVGPSPLTTLIGSPSTSSFSDLLTSANQFYQVTCVDGGGNEGPR